MKFTFDTYSNTIRLMPANHLVAWRRHGKFGDWIIDADMAIKDEFACAIYMQFRKFEIRWASNGFHLAETLNKQLSSPLNGSLHGTYNKRADNTRTTRIIKWWHRFTGYIRAHRLIGK